MNWKEQLHILELAQHWDDAIEYMQKVITENPNDMDAYMFMNYLLMNLLIEEDYDRSKEDSYIALTKWYFDESYAKFSDNPEYLYITAKTAVMCESFYGISVEDYNKMFKKAEELEPNNPLYQDLYYYDLRDKNPNHPDLIAYCKMVLNENSPIKEQLKNKGNVGEYIIGLKEGWCEGVLYNASNKH